MSDRICSSSASRRLHCTRTSLWRFSTCAIACRTSTSRSGTRRTRHSLKCALSTSSTVPRRTYVQEPHTRHTSADASQLFVVLGVRVLAGTAAEPKAATARRRPCHVLPKEQRFPLSSPLHSGGRGERCSHSQARGPAGAKSAPSRQEAVALCAVGRVGDGQTEEEAQQGHVAPRCSIAFVSSGPFAPTNRPTGKP